MWEAIKRLQQGESLNIQDVKTNLFWEFGQFTSHDRETIESYYIRFYKLMNEMIKNNLTVATMQVNVQFLQQLQPEWSRFVTIVKQQHKLDEVSYHKLFDILKQYQREVNELRAERIANTSSLPTRSHTTTRHNGQKRTTKNHQPHLKIASEEDSNLNKLRMDTEMRRIWALIASDFRRSTNIQQQPQNFLKMQKKNGRILLQDTRMIIVWIVWESEDNDICWVEKCTKPKWVKDSTYHKEKMLLCKQAEKGVQLQAEQSDWLADTDEEIDEQELEAHYSYMEKIQEVLNVDSCTNSEPLEQVQYDIGYNLFANKIQHSEQSESISNTYVVETGDRNVILDSPDVCDNDI
ncbi:hypothetical protein Tco_0052367 [Tanacetum coccineum]